MCFWLATVTDRVREGHLPDTAVKESTVLELYCFDDYQSVYPERRRTLGGARPICGAGGCSASYVSGCDCDGGRNGRASYQHDPTVLGIACLSDCRDQPAARDGVYGDEFFCRRNRIWTGITRVG